MSGLQIIQELRTCISLSSVSRRILPEYSLLCYIQDLDSFDMPMIISRFHCEIEALAPIISRNMVNKGGQPLEKNACCALWFCSRNCAQCGHASGTFKRAQCWSRNGQNPFLE